VKKTVVAQAADTKPLPTNSVVENAGMIDHMQITNPQVIGTNNSSATVLKTLPGSQTSNVTIQSPLVSSATSSPVEASANEKVPILATGINMNGYMSNNVFCGSHSIIKNQGVLTGEIMTDTILVEDPIQCLRWDFILRFLAKHREDVGDEIDIMGSNFAKPWAQLPDEQRSKYEQSLAGMRKRLVEASGDDKSFDRALNDLALGAPLFYLPDPPR
jgi:hypothetical protein